MLTLLVAEDEIAEAQAQLWAVLEDVFDVFRVFGVMITRIPACAVPRPSGLAGPVRLASSVIFWSSACRKTALVRFVVRLVPSGWSRPAALGRAGRRYGP